MGTEAVEDLNNAGLVQVVLGHCGLTAAAPQTRPCLQDQECLEALDLGDVAAAVANYVRGVGIHMALAAAAGVAAAAAAAIHQNWVVAGSCHTHLSQEAEGHTLHPLAAAAAYTVVEVADVGSFDFQVDSFHRAVVAAVAVVGCTVAARDRLDLDLGQVAVASCPAVVANQDHPAAENSDSAVADILGSVVEKMGFAGSLADPACYFPFEERIDCYYQEGTEFDLAAAYTVVAAADMNSWAASGEEVETVLVPAYPYPSVAVDHDRGSPDFAVDGYY